MIAESHLDFVADPACGSGAVEALTDALCEAAWSEFQAIEREGGILQSLAAGHLQERILAAREERRQRYRTGERHIVGTTIYPAGGGAAGRARCRPTGARRKSRRPSFARRLDANASTR